MFRLFVERGEFFFEFFCKQGLFARSSTNQELRSTVHNKVMEQECEEGQRQESLPRLSRVVVKDISDD